MNYFYPPFKKIKSWIILVWKKKDAITGVLMAKKNSLLLVLGISTIIFPLNILILDKFYKIDFPKENLSCCNRINLPMDFTNFDNVTGTSNGCYIVPNFVHFIRFKGIPVSYIHMICYLAAFKNQRPEKIYFHYNDKSTFSGKYWEILKNTPGFMDVVEFNHMEIPTEIFGQKLSEGWQEFHASDITRIRMLMKYGGIFLDNDSYLIRSLNDFRRYEMTIGWDDGGQYLGTQVIVAHKDARFLNEWLETYRGAYNEHEWYYNAGVRPTVEVLYKKPELIHRVKYLFGVHNGLIIKIFKEYWPQWRFMYALHLLHRHMYILGSYEKELPSEFDENNVKNYGNTFREMALDVYNPDNDVFKYQE